MDELLMSTTRDAVIEAGRTLRRQVYLMPSGSSQLDKLPEDWTRTPDHASQTQLRSERAYFERQRGETMMEAAAIDPPPRGLQGQRDPGTTPLPVIREGAEPLAAAATAANREYDLSASGTIRRKSDLDSFRRHLLTGGEPSSATLRDAVAAAGTGQAPSSPQRHHLSSSHSPAGAARFASLSSPLRPSTHAGARPATSAGAASPHLQRQHADYDGFSNTAVLLAEAADRDGGEAAGAQQAPPASPARPRTVGHMGSGAGGGGTHGVSLSSASMWPHRESFMRSMGNGGFLTRPGADLAYGTSLVSGRKGAAAGGGPTPYAPYAPPLTDAGPGDGLEEPAILPDHMIKVRAMLQLIRTCLHHPLRMWRVVQTPQLPYAAASPTALPLIALLISSPLIAAADRWPIGHVFSVAGSFPLAYSHGHTRRGRQAAHPQRDARPTHHG